MKATLDIPDDLYRKVKARSALEGRPLRSVAIELFQNWLHADTAENPQVSTPPNQEEIEEFPWLEISRNYAKSGISHDMEDIRKSISHGWATETAKSFRRSDTKA